MKEYDSLILASESPRRRELLKSANISFTVKSHSFDENSAIIDDPITYSEKLSFGKANSFESRKEFDSCYILGVDTIVVFDNMILGKPSSKEEAWANILKMSGNYHQVISGMTIINREKNICFTRSAVSNVKFCKIPEDFIKYYLEHNHWKGYAGGYAIQGIFSLVVEKIKGSYSNIVGLPMETLFEMLSLIKFKIF